MTVVVRKSGRVSISHFPYPFDKPVCRVACQLFLLESCMRESNANVAHFQVLVTMFFRRFRSSSFPQHILGVPSHSLYCLPLPRSFSSKSVRLAQSAAKHASPRPKPKAAPRPKTQDPVVETLKFAGRRPGGLGKLTNKVQKLGEVTLYKAPSQRGYILGSYGLGAFAFGYAVINSQITFGDSERTLPMWQQGLFAGVCVVMSVMGTVFISRTSRLIRAITAFRGSDGLRLRFSVRNMIPFRKPWQLDVPPSQVIFSRQLIVTPDRVTTDGQLRGSSTANLGFFKAPFKTLNYTFFRVFQSIRQIFTQEDFILIELQGQRGAFRMDSNGYVSDDLLLVGNPVKVKYS